MRAISRLADVPINTVSKLLADAGKACAAFHDEKVRDLNAKRIRSEKQSDINVALSLILDAEDGVFDCAYLVSADSDQAATARVFRERFPKKKLIGVAPPTKVVPNKVIAYADDHFVLSKLDIETCVMPQYIPGKTGNMIRRPDEYAPPSGWVHPDDRPRRR